MFEDVVLASKPEAEAVLDAMQKLSKQYGCVTVADYFNLVGISPVYSDEQQGWDDVSDVQIKRRQEGFFLAFPPLKVIKR